MYHSFYDRLYQYFPHDISSVLLFTLRGSGADRIEYQITKCHRNIINIYQNIGSNTTL